MRLFSGVILLNVLVLATSCSFPNFPECGCSTGTSRNSGSGKKVYCNKAADLRDFLARVVFPDNIQAIDFSGNYLHEITSDFFPNTSILRDQIQSLNLANNKIRFIAPSAFTIFKNLKQLNLSYNELGMINKNMFLGLNNLLELYLNYNLFPILPGDAFSPLPSLLKLDLSSDYLICDCLMFEFVSWFRAYKVMRSNSSSQGQKVRLLGTCRLPSSLRGKPLRQLRPRKLGCDTLRELPYFEMQPSSGQVVFEGDSIALNCEGTDIMEAKVNWSRNGKAVGNVSAAIFEEATTRTPNKTLVSSNFQLKEITHKFSGIWRCSINSNHSEVSKQIEIVVLKRGATYCRAGNVTNELGAFRWPATVTGATAHLQCHQPQDKNYKASRDCNSGGTWSEGNYTRCQYIDQVARIIETTLLQDFTPSNALQKCQESSSTLWNETVESPLGVQKIDDLMQKCDVPLVDARQMSSVMARLASVSMSGPFLPSVPPRTYSTIRTLLSNSLYSVFKEDDAFDKSFENVVAMGTTLGPESGSTSLNVTAKMSKKQRKYGVHRAQHLFPQPSVKIPDLNIQPGSKFNLLITVFRNGNLFQSEQTATLSLSQYPPEEAESPPLDVHVLVSDIYALSLDAEQSVMTSQSVLYEFQTQERVSMYDRDTKHYIGIWNGSHWGVSHERCRFNKTFKQQGVSVAVVECKVLSTVAVFKDVSWEGLGGPGLNGTHRSLHPSTIVGSAVLCCTLVFILFTYTTFNNLLLTRDTRHMVLNTCLHLLIAVLSFTVGIWRVDYQVLCYVCGISLHYSSLSVLLWVLLSSRNICKDIMTSQQPPSIDPKPPRPLLRFYLIGCGIPIIICGITAAAKLENYDGDGHKYCWLSWETSLYAFYVAAAVVAIACVLVLLKILATLNCGLEARNIGRQNRSNFDEQTPLHYSGYEGVRDDLRPHLSHKNNEQSFRTRLRGVGLILVFFIATWVAAAMTVASPYIQDSASREIPSSKFNRGTFTNEKGSPANLSEIFSFVFAFLSCSTSVLLFYQHIWSRDDVKRNWKMMSCGNGRVSAKKLSERNSSVSNIIFNQKTSRPKRENASTTIATENTTETNLPTTAPSSNHNSQSRGCNSHVSPSKSCHSHRSPNKSCHSHVSQNRSCNHGFEDKSHRSSHRVAHSHGSNLYHNEKDHLIGGSFANHHYGSHHYFNHSRSGEKSIKLTNLHHESSMTEHSFDNENSMHTLPTMLHRTQPKLDNSALFHRYQKMRKALDAKKNKHKKLSVLREFAHDPITSNDEGVKSGVKGQVEGQVDSETDNNNEVLKDYDVDFKSTDQKLRPLLISARAKPHKKSGNPARRRSSRQQSGRRNSRTRIKPESKGCAEVGPDKGRDCDASNKALDLTDESKAHNFTSESKAYNLADESKAYDFTEADKAHNFSEENKSHNFMDESKGHNFMDESKGHNFLDESKGHNFMDESKGHNFLDESRSHNFMDESKGHNYMTANDLSLFLPLSVTTPAPPKSEVGEHDSEELAYASVRNETSV